jgi:hypothetical protein
MRPAKNIVELLFLCREIPSIFAELPGLIDVSEQIDSGIRESLKLWVRQREMNFEKGIVLRSCNRCNGGIVIRLYFVIIYRSHIPSRTA